MGFIWRKVTCVFPHLLERGDELTVFLKVLRGELQ